MDYPKPFSLWKYRTEDGGTGSTGYVVLTVCLITTDGWHGERGVVYFPADMPENHRVAALEDFHQRFVPAK